MYRERGSRLLNGSEPNNVPALFKVSHEKAMFSVDIDLKRTAWVYIYIYIYIYVKDYLGQ